MACHTINVAALALGLFDPESVEVLDTSGIVDNESYPVWSIIKTNFGEREGRAPLSLTWYDGGKNLPEERQAYRKLLEGQKVGGSGLLLVGEKGLVLLGERLRCRAHPLAQRQVRRSEGARTHPPRTKNHFGEWVEGIKDNDPKKPMSNFDYAGRLTETVLLGVVALRVGGKIEWDPAAMKVKNNSGRRPVPQPRLP